jgi:predicted TIM-barrel fold metal-dependent hydrolase
VDWDIEQMDQGGVATSIISITTPGLWFGKPAQTQRLARQCNDYAANLVSQRRGRFGMFVNLPLPDIDASLKEIEYGLDQLKADGVCVFTNYGGTWWGDPLYAPIYEELNRRKAVVHAHPATANCCVNLLPGITDSLIEYGTDSTRAITKMLTSGTAKKYPDIQMIWSHGGGTLPMLLARYQNLWFSKEHWPEGIYHALRRFHYDTAYIFVQGPLQAVKFMATPSRILFGDDVPFGTAAQHAQGIIESGVFSPEELRMIDRENAVKLFPKYA